MTEFVPYLQAAWLPVLGSQLQAVGVQTLAVNLVDYERQPGFDLIKQAGGLKPLLNWSGQLMVLAGDFDPVEKVKKNLARTGIHYQDPQNQAKLTLKPADYQEWQAVAKADITVGMFQNPDYYAPVDDLERTMQANLEWNKTAPASFFPVLGAGLKALRQASVAALPDDVGAFITNLPPVEEIDEWQRSLELTLELLPQGTSTAVVAPDLATIKLSQNLGIDYVLSAWPLKLGLGGKALADGEIVNIRHQEVINQFMPLEAGCDCLACTGFTQASLHAMLHAKEPLASRLLLLHNIKEISKQMGK